MSQAPQGIFASICTNCLNVQEICIYMFRMIHTTNREVCSTALEFEPRLVSLQDGDI